MKRKKSICLLTVIAMLIWIQLLAIETVKVKKSVSSAEMDSHIIKEENDIVKNNSLLKTEEFSYCLSLETIYGNDLELNIYILLQDVERKTYRVRFNARNQYVEEIYLIAKNYTTLKIFILNGLYNIELHIYTIYMDMENEEIFDIVVTIWKHITKHFFQVSFLSKLMMKILFFAMTILYLCFYEKYLNDKHIIHIMFGSVFFKDNMKQYSMVFEFIPFVITESEECVQKFLIRENLIFLNLNRISYLPQLYSPISKIYLNIILYIRSNRYSYVFWLNKMETNMLTREYRVRHKK